VHRRSNIAEAPTYDAYFEDQLAKPGAFGEVVHEDEFKRMPVQAGTMETVASLDGFVGPAHARSLCPLSWSSM
jgi:hypothetical protein